MASFKRDGRLVVGVGSLIRSHGAVLAPCQASIALGDIADPCDTDAVIEPVRGCSSPRIGSPAILSI